ncbi:hypothetical protein [Georgenia thermotolerans]|uniref:PKD domain-containing protein n=1 Tax=Georgenia thermotolerans TaxID=527326 RepID=A0A7J5UQC5_9MICO|nr:hypothetical protein [Georgenia thermotolerans]KAE8764421.1 hypothetical protein GB883_09085 [Georgenia thermotolerans]
MGKESLFLLFVVVNVLLVLGASQAVGSPPPRVQGETDDDAVAIIADELKRSPRGGMGGGSGKRPAVDWASIFENAACGQYVRVGPHSYRYKPCENEIAPNFPDITAAPPPGDPAEETAPIVVTAQDIQRLPIAPGGLTVQPDQGWVLVNIDTIVWTEAAAQTFSTVVLDTPVDVRVRPADFTWDFGDGSAPVRTTDPGAPFPNHTVSHGYTGAADGRQVTVTTRWAGEFQVAGSGVWQPVQGFAVTTESSAPFEVRTATTALTRD